MNPAINTKKVFGISILLLVLLLIFLVVWWLFGRGRLSLQFETDGTKSVQIINSDSAEITTLTTTDKTLGKVVKGGDYEIKVTDANNRAKSYYIQVPRFLASKNIEVKLTNQYQREKLTRDIMACPVLVSSSIFSSSCGITNQLYSNTPTDAVSYARKTDLGIGKHAGAIAYNDNLLVLQVIEPYVEEIAKPTLTLLNKQGKVVKTVTLPAEFVSNDTSYALTQNKDYGEGFVVSRDNAEELLWYQSLDSKPVIIKPDFKTKIDRNYLGSTIDLYGNKLLISVGKMPSSIDTDDEEVLNKNQDTLINIYDANNVNNPTNFKISDPIEALGFCGKTNICNQHDQSTTLYVIDGDDLKEQLTITSTRDFAWNNEESFMYLKDGSVFILETGPLIATKVFDSKNFTTSSITNSPQGVLVNAFVKGLESGPVHLFKLSNSQSPENIFIDDSFPYKAREFGFVRDSDYVGKQLYVDVFMDSWEGGPGNWTYDQQEFNTKVSAIKNDLKKNSITEPPYTIVIKP